jgi:glycerol uptake operon antiterminator
MQRLKRRFSFSPLLLYYTAKADALKLKPRRISHDLRAHLGKPVIPYITEGLHGPPGDLAAASILFIGGGELAELPHLMKALSREPLASVPVFLHMDLVNGLANDDSGLRYLATLERLDGIITVRPHLVPVARKLNLLSVLRLFLQDGRAVERGLQVIERAQPDAIEIMPGVSFLEVADRFSNLPMPCIAGGLIRTPELVERILGAGAKAVSTTNAALWSLNRSQRPPG